MCLWFGQAHVHAVNVAMCMWTHMYDHACTFLGNQTPAYLIHNIGLWLIMLKPVFFEKTRFFFETLKIEGFWFPRYIYIWDSIIPYNHQPTGVLTAAHLIEITWDSHHDDTMDPIMIGVAAGIAVDPIW